MGLLPVLPASLFFLSFFGCVCSAASAAAHPVRKGPHTYGSSTCARGEEKEYLLPVADPFGARARMLRGRGGRRRKGNRRGGSGGSSSFLLDAPGYSEGRRRIGEKRRKGHRGGEGGGGGEGARGGRCRSSTFISQDNKDMSWGGRGGNERRCKGRRRRGPDGFSSSSLFQGSHVRKSAW